MRTTLVLVLALLLIPLAGSPALVREDILTFPECRYCGMFREHFAHSRMVVHHRHGETVGVCSINCAAIDYVKNVDDLPDAIQVGDYRTKRLIDAEKAYWVIGGNRPGVMTQRAKWAFKEKRDAQAFIDKYGGRFATFEEAMEASYVDMYEDMRQLEQMKREYARSMHARVGSPEKN
jgi:copper chaperone NosL